MTFHISFSLQFEVNGIQHLNYQIEVLIDADRVFEESLVALGYDVRRSYHANISTPLLTTHHLVLGLVLVV